MAERGHFRRDGMSTKSDVFRRSLVVGGTFIIRDVSLLKTDSHDSQLPLYIQSPKKIRIFSNKKVSSDPKLVGDTMR